MIGPFLLLAAQAATPAAQPFCVRAAGSEIMECGLPPQQATQGMYRLPGFAPRSYGPPSPNAQAGLGHGIRLRGQASNSGPAKRNRSMATLSVPF